MMYDDNLRKFTAQENTIRGKGSQSRTAHYDPTGNSKATVDRDPTRMNRNYNRVFGNWYTEVGAKNNDSYN